jgi:hypothetical protein
MKLILDKEYRTYQVERNDFPQRTYIMCSREIFDLQMRPHVAGMQLQERMEEISGQMMDCLLELVLRGTKPSQITELVFLAGGLYYSLNHGFRKRFSRALPQCFLGIKRQRVEGKEGEFNAVATYENFESLPDDATVIIGDTIATGATLQKGIYHLFEALSLGRKKIKNLIVLSLGCSIEGARRMKEIEDRMKRDFPDSSVTFVACGELFHLMPDGTDMRFLYDDAVMPDETRDAVVERYGQELGHIMRCVVFDWGTRCKNPIRHYEEFLGAAKEMLEESTEEKSKKVLNEMINETKEALESFTKPL